MEQVEPRVGTGATLCVGSDSYAYTIVKVSENRKTIWVTADIHMPDKAKGFDYYSNQVFTYTPQVDGTRRVFTLRKNGWWVEKGVRTVCSHLYIGYRRYYQDPSF